MAQVRLLLATTTFLYSANVMTLVHASTPPNWFIADCGPGPWTGWCANEAEEEGWKPIQWHQGKHDDDDYEDEDDDYEDEIDPYLTAEMTGGSKGFASMTMEMSPAGDVEDAIFARTFRIESNVDHEIQLWYDAISVNGICIPVFDREGSGTVKGEADVLGGEISLADGALELFRATAGATLRHARHDNAAGVTIDCHDATATSVSRALVTVTNDVVATFSREYQLMVTAFGEGGSIIFVDGDAINAGDAPAGQYDNDILIATGVLYD